MHWPPEVGFAKWSKRTQSQGDILVSYSDVGFLAVLSTDRFIS